jgi:ABC-type branched-chain amino acid transport systems, periplasmic component
MKKLVGLLLTCLLVLNLAACGNSSKTNTGSSTPASGKIKIGVITSITGERALVGEYAKKSIDMAVEDLNKASGVLGKQVQVVYEDDLGTDVGAVNAFNKMATDKDICAIVGPYYGTMILALNGEIAKAKIPVLSATSLATVASFKNQWLFQARTHDGYVPAALVDFATKKFGNKVSIIYGTDASGVGQEKAAKEALQKKGLTPVTDDAYNSGDKDFTAQLVKVQKANPDVIIAFGLQQEAGLIMKQARAMGIKAPICGLASYVSKIAIDLAGSASEGVYALTDYVPSTPVQKGQDFAKEYKTKYNIESDFTAAVDYDKFQLIVEAIKIANSTDRDAIRQAMFKIQNYQGVSNNFSFDKDGVGGTTILLTQIQNGNAKAIDTLKVR